MNISPSNCVLEYAGRTKEKQLMIDMSYQSQFYLVLLMGDPILKTLSFYYNL